MMAAVFKFLIKKKAVTIAQTTNEPCVGNNTRAHGK